MQRRNFIANVIVSHKGQHEIATRTILFLCFTRLIMG